MAKKKAIYAPKWHVLQMLSLAQSKRSQLLSTDIPKTTISQTNPNDQVPSVEHVWAGLHHDGSHGDADQQRGM